MDPRISNEVSIADLFDQFIEATTMRDVLSLHHRILNYSDISPCEFNLFYPKLKKAILSNRMRKSWKAKALFSKIDKKSAHRCYSNTKAPTPIGNTCDTSTALSISSSSQDDSLSSQANRVPSCNNALHDYNCLVIGSGPAGLRTAIELQLLGASRVIVVEKRSRFSRNNVLHLWPFVIDDLKCLGAKKFYGKFCAGSIDHISIRQLQLILLKISLMIGCDFRDSCSYSSLCPESFIYCQTRYTGQSKASLENSEVPGHEEGALGPCCEYSTSKTDVSKEFIKVSSHIPTLTSSSSLIVSRNESKISETSPHNNQLEQDPDKTSASITCLETRESDSNKDGDKNNSHGSVCRKKGDIVLKGTRAHFKSDYPLQEEELHSINWDIIIGADGRRNTLSKFFPRKEFRGRLAIAITANFINRQTPAEAAVPEISGLSYIYNQDMFNSLAYDTRIELENICYYKDDTHYFVMTAKKRSLLERGVLIKDYPVTQDLLSEVNIDKQALLNYAKDAAYWTTGLEPLDFALNHYGQEDCAMFDFTSMYAASNACKALKTKEGGLTLISLVGDTLLEPFWPTGSGCARGFLSSFDAAWMCRQWAVNRCATTDHQSVQSRLFRNKSPNGSLMGKSDRLATYNRMALSVIAERESIYRILAQTTSENLHQNYSHWTLNPHSRYPNLNRHLISPSQVEHLITDGEGNSCVPITTTGANKSKLRAPKIDKSRRSKSPVQANTTNPRKSPKKLKSANASPLAQSKSLNRDQRARSLATNLSKRYFDEFLFDELNQEYETTYQNLIDIRSVSKSDYLDHRPRARSEFHDDSFRPSISGTLPSSNNLLNLEANRARDIDECLRQRRQKTQLKVVRDEIIGRLRGGSVSHDTRAVRDLSVEPSSLFHELRRIKEQSIRGRENFKTKDVNGLTLFNSMRRCASFAERVKSFESKLSNAPRPNPMVDTRSHIDTVRNLPHFEALQELFVGNNTTKDDEPKKSRIPVMKLSKDDWNVKCWEDRLSNYKQRSSRDLSGSSKTLSRAFSADSQQAVKPTAKQVAVFKDRIKQMANKLETAQDNGPHSQLSSKRPTKDGSYGDDEGNAYLKSNARSKGWVSHLRRELIRGSSGSAIQNKPKQAMNPNLPSKPIKKLFEDDDDDDDGIDVNKHYDHLCINRPTNKYLSRNNGYMSHLVRSKYSTATARVINRPNPTAEAKQAYMANLTSRGSSVSSTLSDSSNGSSTVDRIGQSNDRSLICIRCRTTISSLSNKICIGKFNLHRTCLSCSGCGISLRTDELQTYLSRDIIMDGSENPEFNCSICEPRVSTYINDESEDKISPSLNCKDVKSQIRSREDFLTQKINYNELYKNLLIGRSETINVLSGVADLISEKSSCSSMDRFNRYTQNRTQEDEELTNFSEKITLESESSFRVVESEINKEGHEQVTIILPASEDTYQDGKLNADVGMTTWRSTMIDEEELERIHNPKRTSGFKSGPIGSSKNSDEDNTTTSDVTSSSDDGDKNSNEDLVLSEDLSSVKSNDDSDAYEDTDIDDSDINQSEAHDVGASSDELDHTSAHEEPSINEEIVSRGGTEDDSPLSRKIDGIASRRTSPIVQLTRII